MFLKFGKEEAYIRLVNNNINVDCNGKLTVKDFLSHEIMNNSLTKDELSQQIDHLESKIRKLEDVTDRQILRLKVLKYKDNEVKITIKEDCVFPF